MSEGREKKNGETVFYYECDKCGKRLYGWDMLAMTVVDLRHYCKQCCVETFGFIKGKNDIAYAPKSLYRIAHTFSSMYDDAPHFATTLENVAKEARVLMSSMAAKHFEKDPMMFNWGYGLTGHIDSEHWEIYVKGWSMEFAFVYEPSPEELEKIQKLRRLSK